MDCRIEFNDGSVINIPNVDGTWTWFDLCETLADLGEISNSQYDEVDSAVDLDSQIQEKLSLLKNQPSSESGGVRRILGRPIVKTENKSPVVSSRPTPVPGLKRKSSKRVSPAPAPKQVPSKGGGLVRKIKQIQPTVVSNLTFSMPLKCSRDGSDWTATLICQQKPIKSEINTPQTSSGKFGGSIHLVLDDSASMDGPANHQLKSAAATFLADRPPQEHIVLHTFNNSLSGAGSPSHISGIVSQLECPGMTPMRECLTRVSGGVSSGDVIIFFTDGGSTDGDPTSIVSSIKGNGVRFISIGCGGGVNKSLLRKLSSTKGDYHHAKSASGIMQAFQAVAKSLGQQQIARSSSGKKSGSTIVARQIQSKDHVTTSSAFGTTVAPIVLADDEGFEFIEEFKCHHCPSTERIACAFCNKNMCSGGARLEKVARMQSKATITTIRCPYCNEESEVEITQKGVHGGVDGFGVKGKK